MHHIISVFGITSLVFINSQLTATTNFKQLTILNIRILLKSSSNQQQPHCSKAAVRYKKRGEVWNMFMLIWLIEKILKTFCGKIITKYHFKYGTASGLFHIWDTWSDTICTAELYQNVETCLANRISVKYGWPRGWSANNDNLDALQFHIFISTISHHKANHHLSFK